MVRLLYSILIFSAFSIKAAEFQLSFENAFPKLQFKRPIAFLVDPQDHKRAYVLEQRGQIWSFTNSTDVKKRHLVADLSDRLGTANEEGLLCMVFHPDYPKKSYVYLYYSAKKPRRSTISRFHFINGKIDLGSETVLMSIDEPYGNHNGGQLAFGPDGFLYIGVGDGGWRGDPKKHGQNKNSLHAAILRIDVDHRDLGKNYAIPADNPFVGEARTKAEIFAFGLRNPWRFSFDSQTGQILCGDVGQNKSEEIDLIKKGGNYGWPRFEGFRTYNKKEKLAHTATPPIFAYNRDQGFSVTGGLVYRGLQLPSLQGWYLFCDYGSNNFWALKLNHKGRLQEKRFCGNHKLQVSSFAVDQHGEIYACSFSKKAIYKLTGLNQTKDAP